MVKNKMKCPNRKKRIGLVTFNCKYCNLELCLACRDMSVHKCSKLEDCKKSEISDLKRKLDSEQIISQKMIKI